MERWGCTRDPSQIWLVKSRERIPSGSLLQESYTKNARRDPGRMEGSSGINPHLPQLYKTLKAMGKLPRPKAPMRASPTLLVTRPRLSPTGDHSESAANHPTGRRPQALPPHLGPSRPRSRTTARTQVGPSRLALRWLQHPIRGAISSNLAT